MIIRRCQHGDCGAILRGRQEKWCSSACAEAARRMRYRARRISAGLCEVAGCERPRDTAVMCGHHRALRAHNQRTYPARGRA